MLCNAEPRKNLPVLIDSDLYYILIITAFALTNGYLANITFINVPRYVDFLIGFDCVVSENIVSLMFQSGQHTRNGDCLTCDDSIPRFGNIHWSGV
jgi:hypothetical protein